MSIIIITWALSSSVANAACKAPPQSVETQRQEQLAGDIHATVLAFGGGVSGERTTNSTWEASLPSQEATDNQLYLYRLCQEYEAGRLSRSQYCEISAGLWSRITGFAVSPDSCLTEVSSLPSTQEASPGQAPSPKHWTSATIGAQGFDLFGPYGVEPAVHYYLQNRGVCVTRLTQQEDESWLEENVMGLCDPWESVSIEQSSRGLVLMGDGERHGLQAAGTPADDSFSGDWAGQAELLRQNVLGGGMALLAPRARKPMDAYTRHLIDLEMKIAQDGRIGTVKYNTGCMANVKLQARGPFWIELKEDYTDVEGADPDLNIGCAQGVITLVQLNRDMALFAWMGPLGSQGVPGGVLHKR